MSTIMSAVDATAVAEPVNVAATTATTSGMAESPATTCCGTVKWFDSKKGFGFILNPQGQDVFVHFSSIEGDGFRVLKDGERVSFEQLSGAKGLQARRVRREPPGH